MELGKDTKLIAATEVGSIPDPDLLIAYDVHWLWFAAWGDTFINNPEYNSPELLKKVRYSFWIEVSGCLLTFVFPRPSTTPMS